MDYKEILREFDLREAEVSVYINLLKKGESTAQEIARISEIPRTTVYHILDRLLNKGLVGSVTKKSITYFQANHPKVIIQQLEDKKKRLETVLPQINSLIGTIREKPKATIFEGVKGIRSVLEDVLEAKQEILHYGDISSLTNALPFVFPLFIVKRVGKKIPIRIIGKKEDIHNKLIRSQKKELRKFVFVPDKFAFKSNIFIYNTKVAILMLSKEPYYAIVIDNEEFYETQKINFELLWNAHKTKFS